jgi:hypothetical protein
METNDCKHDKRYFEEYDAFYCIKCMKWLEKKCDDPECEFCSERPERPEQKNG